MRIRNSCKAIIIQGEKLLCNRYEDERGVYFSLPGGGQDYQENLREAVRRECREEIAADVAVHELLFVRDYIGRNHAGQERLQRVHQVEFFFRCELLPGETPALGEQADHYQTGVEWIPLRELGGKSFFPAPLAEWLPRFDHPARPVYLGDVD